VLVEPRRAIVVFALAPEEEARRKPLVEAGSRRSSEAVYRHLLDRALTTAAAVPEARISLVTTGDLLLARRAANAYVSGDRLAVRSQDGATFAERLRHAVEAEFAAGFAQVLVVGTDTPELTSAHLVDAFAALDGGDTSAVLGPSVDGGYYLLGLSSFSAAAFERIVFGGSTVAVATAHALSRAGFRVQALEPLGDLDRLADVIALLRRLAIDPAQQDSLRRVLRDLLASAGPSPAPESTSPHLSSQRSQANARGPPLVP
jgi:rSAM/selenodomain-associated transferase 1